MAFDGPALDIVHERRGDVAHQMHWHGCAGRYIYFTIGGEHAPRSSGGSGRGKTLRGAVPHPRGPRCNRSLIGYSRLLAPVLRARNAGGRLPSRFNVVIRRRRISRTSISWTLFLLSIYVYTQLPTRQPARIHLRLLRRCTACGRIVFETVALWMPISAHRVSVLSRAKEQLP